MINRSKLRLGRYEAVYYFLHFPEQLREFNRQERREREKTLKREKTLESAMERAAQEEPDFQCRKNHERDPKKTTFLTLPNELRQQILLDTFDAAEPLPNLSNANVWKRRVDIYNWAVKLRSADMCLHGDVFYALKQWFDEFGTWHDSELQKINELIAQVEEISEKIQTMPGGAVGMFLYMEYLDLLWQISQIQGQDDSDSED